MNNNNNKRLNLAKKSPVIPTVVKPKTPTRTPRIKTEREKAFETELKKLKESIGGDKPNPKTGRRKREEYYVVIDRIVEMIKRSGHPIFNEDMERKTFSDITFFATEFYTEKAIVNEAMTKANAVTTEKNKHLYGPDLENREKKQSFFRENLHAKIVNINAVMKEYQILANSTRAIGNNDYNENRAHLSEKIIDDIEEVILYMGGNEEAISKAEKKNVTEKEMLEKLKEEREKQKQEAKNELNELKKQKQEEQAEIDKIKEQIQEEQAEIDKLKKEGSNINDLTKSIDNYKKQIDEKEKQLEEANEKLEGEKRKLAEANEKLEEAEKKNRELEDANKNLTKGEKKNRELEEEKRKLAEANEKLAEANKKLEEAEKKNRELEDANENLTKANENLETKTTKLEGENRNLAEEKKKLEEEKQRTRRCKRKPNKSK